MMCGPLNNLKMKGQTVTSVALLSAHPVEWGGLQVMNVSSSLE